MTLATFTPWRNDIDSQTRKSAALTESATLDPSTRKRLNENFGKLPLYFVENAGQIDERVAFYIQGSDKKIYFTSEGVTFALQQPTESSAPASLNSKNEVSAVSLRNKIDSRIPPKRWVVKLDFVGARRDVRPEGFGETQATFSYFKGQRKDWKAGVRSYSQIIYRDLWPGIDLVYAGTVNRMKYSFIVHPGADPRQIRLSYRGISSAVVTPNGELNVKTPLGDLNDERPLSSQQINGRDLDLPTKYQLETSRNSGSVVFGFTISPYDESRDLVIDPALFVYCGYIGGDGEASGQGIAVDAGGNAYVVGFTSSSELTFPVTAGPDLAYNGGSYDAFIAKVNATGTALVYCGYIGGGGAEFGTGIAVDASGNAYVVGYTNSTQPTFPVTLGPDLTYNGEDDVFVAKVNATGTALVYCGYIGGDLGDYGAGIAVDASGNAYVAGGTRSTESTFPVAVGPELIYNGGLSDAFIAKVNATGSALIYCGYLGGSGHDFGAGIAVDAGGNAYVVGGTKSSESTFPVTIGPDLTLNSSDDASCCTSDDAFVAKVNATGAALVYCGYIGGSGPDNGSGIAVDASGNAYVVGGTRSSESTFPVAVGPDLTFNGGSYDAFVAKVNVTGTALVYCGYIGGGGPTSMSDQGYGIAVDASGNAYVMGDTNSTEPPFFPVTVGPDLVFNGKNDAFVAKVNATGAALVYCGYIGGSEEDYGYGIAVDGSGNAYVVGYTFSTESTFPVTVGPDLIFNGQDIQAFVAKVSFQPAVIEYEADVAPRPTGSGTVAVSDWVQVGRFSVGLDTPVQGSEAQRADCAPRSTLGDGHVTVADWVQAGRYSVGLDPLTAAGGPTLIAQAFPGNWNRAARVRDVQIASQALITDPGFVSLPVELAAQGGENGVTFSLHYDPSLLSYQGYELGKDAEIGTTLLENRAQVAAGRIGFGIVLRPGAGYEPGIRELIRVKLKILGPAIGVTEVRIADGPTALSLVGVDAEALSVKPVGRVVKIGKRRR
jgi:hypothetical protein